MKLCVPKSKKITTVSIQIVSDISSIAWFNCRGGKPKIKNIDLMYESIQKEFKIIGIADSSLYHKIDNKKEYKEKYLETKIIIEAPAYVPADIYIIKFALKNESYILSNDTFKEFDFFDKNWMKTQRITFMIIENQFFIFNPQINTQIEKSNHQINQTVSPHLFEIEH